jgi:cell division transport system ATP-binding protein
LSSPSDANYIVFDKIEVRYNEFVTALKGVSLNISRGEFCFFVGKTGSGKSSLLKIITREVSHTSGKATWNGNDLNVPGKEIPALRRQMGIVPQDFALLPRKRVWENVAYAMRAVGATRKEARRKVAQILEVVNIGHRADAFPHELSGGEQQRVAIGRALINHPELLIADEPTGNLDPEHSWEIMELLRQLNLRGTTVLVASHDVMVVERMGCRTITMDNGNIVSDTHPENISGIFQNALDFNAAPTVSPSYAEISRNAWAEQMEEVDA